MTLRDVKTLYRIGERKRLLGEAVVIGYIDGFKCYDKENKYKEIVNPKYIKIILKQRGYL
ncbi:MAG: hypothetical protein RBR23_01530 [Arcobacteraceae bacterium]|jgi:hypothetical protein|nr:hypothetical protein [Arcobacteraceae bacterium]